MLYLQECESCWVISPPLPLSCSLTSASCLLLTAVNTLVVPLNEIVQESYCDKKWSLTLEFTVNVPCRCSTFLIRLVLKWCRCAAVGASSAMIYCMWGEALRYPSKDGDIKWNISYINSFSGCFFLFFFGLTWKWRVLWNCEIQLNLF